MNDSKSQTLSDICAELFSLSVYLRESRELEQPDILHERITGILSAIDEKVRELSLSEADTEDITEDGTIRGGVLTEGQPM